MITYIFQFGEYDYQIVQFNPHQIFAIYHGDSLIGEIDYNGQNWFQNSGSKLPQSVIEAIGKLIESHIK